ncbi:pyridoxamine 5'-phosphate oxidase family protein [Anaerotignum sp.]
MNANVVKVLKEQLWHVATYGEEANVVPVGFKDVTEDGKLVIGVVLMEETLKNIAANGKIAVSACDGATAEGYQVKGTAEFVTEGPVVDMFKKIAEDTFKGAMPAKGAIIMTPEKVIVTTPGPDNKKLV